MSKPRLVAVPPEIAGKMKRRIECAGSRNDWQFPEWSGMGMRASPLLDEYIRVVRCFLANDGYAVVSFGGGSGHDSECGMAATAFLSELGAPIKVFRNSPSHWKPVDVDIARPANRSRGTGYQAPHTDFVNAEFPPDLVCLYCVRPDPLGGGQSIISNFDEIEKELPAEALDCLSERAFSDGKVDELAFVGRDANPFQVYAPEGQPRLRFTGNLLASTTASTYVAAIRMLSDVIQKRSQSLLLQAGELLIVDQRRALHGRQALGSYQERLPPSERRLLLQSYVRVNS